MTEMRDTTLGLAEVAAPIHTTKFVAISDGLGHVRILSVPSAKELAGIDTVLDPGGRRLAVVHSSGADLIATGSWDRREIVGYQVDTGREAWRRAGVGRVERITPAGHGGYLAVGFDTGPMLVLDAGSGDTVARIDGGRAYWQATPGELGVLVTSTSLSVVSSVTWTKRGRYPLRANGVLDVATQADSLIAVSEAADIATGESGQLSCLTADLALRWAATTRLGTHVPWLGYNTAQSLWVGVEADLEVSSRTLVSWSMDGKLRSRVPVPIAPDYAFTLDGGILVAAGGAMFDAVSGHQVSAE